MQKDVIHFDDHTNLIVKKRTDEIINEIDNPQLAEEVMNIFENVKWKTNIDVDMPYEPDYKINDYFHLWVTLDGDKLDVIYTKDNYYAQLSEKTSAKLFEIMVRE